MQRRFSGSGCWYTGYIAVHGRGRLNSARGPTQLLCSGDCSTLGSLVKIASVSGDVRPGSRATCGGCCGLGATTGAATSSNGGRRGISATCGDGVCGWVATRGGKATRGWGVCGWTATRGSKATRGWGLCGWEATCCSGLSLKRVVQS